jgi:hypothetical protein
MSNDTNDHEEITQYVTTKVETIDPKTGDLYVEKRVRMRLKHNQEYVTMFCNTIEDVLLDKDMKGAKVKLFFYLAMNMEFGNKIYKTNASIAKALNLHPSTVSIMRKSLREKGLLISDGKIDRLNSNYAWKGSIQTLKEKRKKEHLKLVKQ